MKKFLNFSVIIASMLLMAISCDPEDIGFNVSKLVGETYLVEVTESTAGVIEETKQGKISLQDSEEFQDYKEDFEVASINEIFIKIEPAEGETAVIGSADIQEAYVIYTDMGGSEIKKVLPENLTTLAQIATMEKVDILSLFTQDEIDGIVDMFNFGSEFEYEIGLKMNGQAPIKFNISYYVDVTAKVNPL